MKQEIADASAATRVAILGEKCGYAPYMHVSWRCSEEGRVLLKTKRTHSVKFTAPAAGEVVEVNRGAKRVSSVCQTIKVNGSDAVTIKLQLTDRGASRSNFSQSL